MNFVGSFWKEKLKSTLSSGSAVYYHDHGCWTLASLEELPFSNSLQLYIFHLLSDKIAA